jgi:hypothetical protein
MRETPFNRNTDISTEMMCEYPQIVRHGPTPAKKPTLVEDCNSNSIFPSRSENSGLALGE